MADSRQEIPLSLRHTPAVLFQDGACWLCPRLCGLWHRSLDSSPARAADDTTLNGAHWRCATWRYPAARSAWGSCSLQPHSLDTARPSCRSHGQRWRHREGNPSSSREAMEGLLTSFPSGHTCSLCPVPLFTSAREPIFTPLPLQLWVPGTGRTDGCGTYLLT